MRKLVVVAVCGCALLFAGLSAAGMNLRVIKLHRGQSVTIGHVKVVDVAATKVITLTGPTVTVSGPTVTLPQKTVTVTVPGPVVTVTTAGPPPPPPPPSGTAIVKDFSGNGDLDTPPFTTSIGETLTWTWQNTNGDFPTGMFISDDAQFKVVVHGDGQTTSGSTYLAPGSHQLSIITIGNWTIHVG